MFKMLLPLFGLSCIALSWSKTFIPSNSPSRQLKMWKIASGQASPYSPLLRGPQEKFEILEWGRPDQPLSQGTFMRQRGWYRVERVAKSKFHSYEEKNNTYIYIYVHIFIHTYIIHKKKKYIYTMYIRISISLSIYEYILFLSYSSLLMRHCYIW